MLAKWCDIRNIFRRQITLRHKTFSLTLPLCQPNVLAKYIALVIRYYLAGFTFMSELNNDRFLPNHFQFHYLVVIRRYMICIYHVNKWKIRQYRSNDHMTSYSWRPQYLRAAPRHLFSVSSYYNSKQSINFIYWTADNCCDILHTEQFFSLL
jgi:hypothetical protein